LRILADRRSGLLLLLLHYRVIEQLSWPPTAVAVLMYQEKTGFFLSNRARMREFVSPLGLANEYAIGFDCRRELASFLLAVRPAASAC